MMREMRVYTKEKKSHVSLILDWENKNYYHIYLIYSGFFTACLFSVELYAGSIQIFPPLQWM